jgi:hypothetical protein
MSKSTQTTNLLRRSIRLALAMPLLGGFAANDALAATVNLTVNDELGNAVSGFRYIVEEDDTYQSPPGVHVTDPLSVQLHNTKAKVITTGESPASEVGTTSISFTEQPGKNYFVSVLPFDGGHSMGGSQVKLDATGTATVTTQVITHNLPTSQISVQIFHDHLAIDNWPSLPAESPADQANGMNATQFTIKVFDAGGGWGAMGPGPVLTDAFGNPLGTTYDGFGNVLTPGNGILHPDANGLLIIQNLTPGKYGIEVVPPAGQGWVQTNTIEGTKQIDAWVAAGNSPFFAEFGPVMNHAHFGFIKEFSLLPGAGGATVTGRILNDHFQRPPSLAAAPGAPFPECRIAINDAAGRGIYHARCNADSSFSIPNVPAGTYQLVAFDSNQDMIISFFTLIVNPGDASVNMGDLTAPAWFHTSKHTVFLDNGGTAGPNSAEDGNGFKDAGEIGLPLMNVNLRFRDGRLYQFAPTDPTGEVAFNEVFPFFHWLVAEVDFARHKATGLTTIADDGGPVDPAWTGGFPYFDELVPQPQFCTTFLAAETGCTVGSALNNPNSGDNRSKTETGPILTYAFQGFAGETNVFEWGKKLYEGEENGGISGIVFYSATRAEDDPQYGTGDPWEPGVPDVTVNLYSTVLCGTNPGVTCDADELHELNADDGSLAKILVNTVQTDSWDDSKPTGCQGPAFSLTAGANTNVIDCMDGLRNYDQVRFGVYNGAYGFMDYCPTGLDPLTGSCFPDSNGDPVAKTAMIPWDYIVEVVPPAGYEVVKEEDKNVELGDAWAPSPQLLPAQCVGAPHLVPPYLSLHTDSAGDSVVTNPIAAPHAGETRPLCDQKLVPLNALQNAATDFHIFTDTPKSARVVGTTTNDLMATLDPTAPSAGEKLTPAWVPMSFRDSTGKEIVRVYSDEYGSYEALLPSTWTANTPNPSGYTPNMMAVCVNDSGTVPNPDFPAASSVPFLQDPFYDKNHSTTCFTFQYMPQSITYLDTPVVPQSAFAGLPQYPVDCEQPTTTPAIAKITVAGSANAGQPGNQVVLDSAGILPVPNPNFDGLGLTGQTAKTVKRNFGFGAAKGTVILTNQRTGGTRVLSEAALTWNTNRISFNIPTDLANGKYEVQVKAAGTGGRTSPTGVTLISGNQPGQPIVHVLPSAVAGATPIQDAIDAAAPGSILLVHAGYYDEYLTLTKPVQIVGQGAYSTFVYGGKTAPFKMVNWRTHWQDALGNGEFDLLPGQSADPALTFITEEGAAVHVMGNAGGEFTTAPSRIDGLTITGADNGGGILVHGHATGQPWDGTTGINRDRHLDILNNRIASNSGNMAGGIRIGYGNLVDAATGNYTDGDNDNIRIRWNHIAQNGAIGVAVGTSTAGGGIGLFKGADGYAVADNFICGNFANGQGGGIGHSGFSDNGRIERNTIQFNQTLAGALAVYGGGISISGPALLASDTVSEGAGSVVIDSNRLQGNHAGAGDGGGISLKAINGEDVRTNVDPTLWDTVNVINNLIVNNVAAWAGGGIALQDALRVNIDHNTVANNDSTATVGQAFPGANRNLSDPQPAGIVAHQHSPNLGQLANAPNGFSAPLTLANNIVWHNRSFHWTADQDGDPLTADPALLPDLSIAGTLPVYDDFGVIPASLGSLAPVKNLVMTGTPEADADDVQTLSSPFNREYVNGGRKLSNTGVVLSPKFATAAAFDEAGNNVSVEYGPLTQMRETYNATANTLPSNTAAQCTAATQTLIGCTWRGTRGDYHLNTPVSPAVNPAVGTAVGIAGVSGLNRDYDRNNRPRTTPAGPDIGADERGGIANQRP